MRQTNKRFAIHNEEFLYLLFSLSKIKQQQKNNSNNNNHNLIFCMLCYEKTKKERNRELLWNVNTPRAKM
jgi:spore maturation protein CgeB